MIPVQFDYVAPESVEEAVTQLKQSGNANVMAGGLSLLPAMKFHRAAPSMLVDLRKISELRQIKYGKNLQISAMTTYAEIAADKNIREHYHALTEAIDNIGDPQVRNRGTIGGSLAYNDPAADLPAAALALEATINVIGSDGTRAIPADEFLLGASKTSLKSDEIISAIDFPASSAESGSAYEKFKNPASGYAICGVAAVVTKASDGTIGKCRVAITGAADHAVRLQKVEAALQGKTLTADNLTAAAGQVGDEGLTFKTDVAASAQYRAHLAQVLIERAFTRAAERAGISLK